MEQERDPLAFGEIHEGGAAVLHGSGQLSSTPARRPPSPLRPSSPHPGGHGAPHPPSPTVAAEPNPVLVALVAVVLLHHRSPPAPTPMAGIDRPRLPLPYVANVCFKCFSYLKSMLELFLIDVAKVDRDMLHMLQVFQKHVANVCSKCFIYFQTYVAIIFYLDIAYVLTHML